MAASLPSSLPVRSSAPGFTRFSCTTCGGDRAGLVTSPRSWPRLPLRRNERNASRSPRVVCTSCDTAHPLGALERLTTGELHALLVHSTVALTAMTVRAGDRGDRDLRRRAVQHVRGQVPAYDQNRLDRDMATFDPAHAPDLVAPLADELETEGKERLVADLVRVALAAHTITAHQRWLFESVGTRLGLSPLHLNGIVTGVAASVEPPAEHP